MIKFGQLSLWAPLAAGEIAVFSRSKPRNVRLHVNAPQKAFLEITQDGKRPFAVVVDGMEGIEVFVEGPFTLNADVDIDLRAEDGEMIHVPKTDQRNFARVTERRARDHRLELIERMMVENADKRIKAMLADARSEISAATRARIKGDDDAGSDQGAGAEGGDAGKPGQKPAGGRKAAGKPAEVPEGTEDDPA